jgi:hypothetical protein
MDLKTGFSKQTDDNDNRVENFNVGLGLQAGDLQDWEKL